MGEKSDQIERHIEAERGQLGANLDQLQARVNEITDWRTQFEKRPMLMMGVAIGGGLLLASLTGRRSKPRRDNGDDLTSLSGARSSFEHNRGTELQKNKALETFDSMKGALIGVAADTFQDFLGQIIPGFRAHFDKVVQEKQSRTAGSEHSTALS